MQNPLVMFGCAAMAKIMYAIFTDSGRKVESLCVDASHLRQKEFTGLPVVAFEEVEKHYPPDSYDFIVATGYQKLNRLRQEKTETARTKGYNIATCIHPSAIISNGAQIEGGAFVGEGVIISSDTRVGQGVVLAPGSIINHGTTIGDFCWIAGTMIGGDCHIGARSFLGLNTMVNSGVTVGSEAIACAGAKILKDLPAGSLTMVSGDSPLPFEPERIKKIADKILYK